jgi:integrase
LRASLRRCAKYSLLGGKAVPVIPEYRSAELNRNAPPKGSILTTKQIATLYDEIEEPHLKVAVIALTGTLSRIGALLDFEFEQIDWANRAINLNPKGRKQTKKYRPELPIVPSFEPWLRLVQPGNLITWREKRITSVKTGISAAAEKAGLPDTTNTYSIRHAGGKFMVGKGVNPEERGVWLGHLNPAGLKRSTAVYSKFSPEFMSASSAAIDAFMQEIASYTKTPFLEPPLSVQAYFQTEGL